MSPPSGGREVFVFVLNSARDMIPQTAQTNMENATNTRRRRPEATRYQRMATKTIRGVQQDPPKRGDASMWQDTGIVALHRAWTNIQDSIIQR